MGHRRRTGRTLVLYGATLFVSVAPRPASALQPLEVFLAAARSDNPDQREARATARQRQAEADATTAKLLPAISGAANYTRNQYEVSFVLPEAFGGTGEPIKIQLQDQLDATVGASIPIVNVGLWERRGLSRATAEAAVAAASATELEVARQTARAYYQLVAAEAVLNAAKKNVELARQTMTITQTKRESGTASELDVKRAEADLARSDQNVVTAELQIVVARRSLLTLTGVEATPVTEYPIDDLHPETALGAWLERVNGVPAVRSAAAARRAAEKSVSVAKAAWLPTLSASAQERFTNATSFAGRSSYYLLQASAAWQLDASIPATVRAQRAAEVAARAREDKAKRTTSESIFVAWQQINTDIANARTARIQANASTLAADLARDRYEGGLATQLDLLQARQDAFVSDLALIRAYADLAYARIALRLYAGQPPQTEPR